MSATSAAHGSGFRRSIASATESIPTPTAKVDWAVKMAVAFYLAVYDKADGIVSQYVDREKSTAHNIVGAAITLGLSVIMLILMAIVAGYFVQEAPSDGAFSDAINQVEDVGGTGFVLLAVALLAVPVVAIVGYFINSGLGGFINTGMGR